MYKKNYNYNKCIEINNMNYVFNGRDLYKFIENSFFLNWSFV